MLSKERGEMLLPSKIVFEVVAFGLEGIVILIFNLPSGATRQDNLCYSVM